MTTITPFAAGAYATGRTTRQITALKGQLDTLSTQLSTGRTAETYGGLGAGRTRSLSAHAALSALTGYDAAIDAGQTRAKLAVASLNQVADLGTTLRGTLSNALAKDATSAGVTALSARDALSSALDALNQSAAGSYLFGGRDTEDSPVLDADTILNGDTSDPNAPLDGLKDLVSDQIDADVGADGTGRLDLESTGDTSLSLTEDGSAEARANFGFSLKDAKATGAALTVSLTAATPATASAAFDRAPKEGERFRVVLNQPDGSQRTVDFTARANPSATDADTFPVVGTAADANAALARLVAPGTLASVQSAAPTDTPPGPGLSLSFSGGAPAALSVGLGSPAAQPAVGDTLTVRLALHDGTTTTVTLTAKASAEADATDAFAIGADPKATAANLQRALGNALKEAAAGPLTASATVRASSDFFAGSTAPGLAPRRIATDANGVATGYVREPGANTVIWYRGDDSGTGARTTAQVRIGATRTLDVGARANEAPLRSVLAGMAAVAVGMPTGATFSDTRGQALASRTGGLLGAASTSPSVQDIATDLSLSSNAMSDASQTNATARKTLQDTVGEVENASIESVAAQLLTVQNRLQASYQVTASLAKLSLVNYLN